MPAHQLRKISLRDDSSLIRPYNAQSRGLRPASARRSASVGHLAVPLDIEFRRAASRKRNRARFAGWAWLSHIGKDSARAKPIHG